MVLGYAPFAFLPALAAGAGIAVGMGTPAPLVGMTLATALVLVTAVTAGYAVGLALKGLFRRSPWLASLKPLLGAVVIVGYFWLSTTGRLGRLLTEISPVLESSPLGWLADVAFLTTANASASVLNAVGAVVLSVAFVPVGILAVIRAAEYAWYVDAVTSNDTTDTTDRSDSERLSNFSERIDSALGALGVSPGTRGVTTTVLLRGYRSPLQLVYIAVPLLFVLPAIETSIRTGVVPEWLPWVVLLYGAWAAGAAFPLNILGNQGATLPTLLTAQIRGRQVVHGYILATVLVFAPLTIVAGIGAAHYAERSLETLVSVGIAAPVVVTAGAIFAAGIGVVFPRFKTIDLTATTKALLPSKVAFGLFSFATAVAVSAVSILTDELYAVVMSNFLSTYLPYGITVETSPLETVATGAVVVLLITTPLAYLLAVRRIDTYRLD